MGAPPVTAMVARDHELAALYEAWSATSGGQGSIVLIHAPAGFGKSTLVRALLSRIRPRLLVRATADADECGVRFAVIAQLVRGLDEPLPAHLRALAGNLPVDADPLAVGAQLLSLLDERGVSGLSIVVDDLQWADAPSIQALVFALRRLRDNPVFAVLTCRSDALTTLPSSMQRLLDDARTTLVLRPFDAADIRELAARLGRPAVTDAMAERIAGHSAGSPLYSRAILDELATAGLEQDADRPLPVPESYSQLIAAKLAECAADGAALTMAAAVFSQPRPLSLVSAAGAVAEPFTALDAAVTAGLLQPLDGDRLVRLSHPLARAAVRQSLPAATRAALHIRAAELLEPIDAAAALRQRIAAASGTDDELAARAADHAFADFKRGAWLSAADGFQAAVRLSRAGDVRVQRLLLHRVEALANAGDAATAPGLLEQLEQHPLSADREYLQARLCLLILQREPARVHLESAWALATESGGAEVGVRIAAELALLAVQDERPEDAARWEQQRLELQSTHHVPSADATGILLLSMGVHEHPMRPGSAAAGRDDPDEAKLDALLGRGVLRVWSDDLDEAVADLSAVLRAPGQDATEHQKFLASAYLADAAFRLGEWDATISRNEAAIARATDIDHLRTLPVLHSITVLVLAARGELVNARTHLAAAQQTAAAAGDLPGLLWSATAAAIVAEADGNTAGVLAAVEPLRAMQAVPAAAEPGIVAWQPILADALICLGSTTEADAILASVRERALQRGHQPLQLAAARIGARICLELGQAPRAVAALEGAAKLRQRIAHRPFDTARFDLVQGQALLAAEQVGGAALAFRSAHQQFLTLGAALWAERAVQGLRSCDGTRPPAARRSGELSTHEMAIARLVAAGLSNREIAAELVVSGKTVEYHLTRIFGKLGVRSRAQLAVEFAAAARDERGSADLV